MLTVVLYIVIPKGLLPEQDTGLITGVVQADQNIAFPQMEQRTKAVAEALRKRSGGDRRVGLHRRRHDEPHAQPGPAQSSC